MEVQRIAKLAKLDLSKEEIEKYQKELSAVLDYVEKLKKVNIAGIAPTSHPCEIKNIFRKDEARKTDEKTIKSLIKAAPERKDGCVKVKWIFKN